MSRSLALPSVFSNQAFHWCLNFKVGIGAEGCDCMASGPGDFDKTNSNGASAVDVCGWQLYA